MANIFKKFKKKNYLTDTEVEDLELKLLALKDDAEKICRNKNLTKEDFQKLCEIGRTIAVYKKRLKEALKYSKRSK